ncbi:MAG TPA: RNA-binding S4 domain-containing protein [Solirubrobacteraceae bacterium]|nr:RNA-binding S4 domain-containing protein [Solirubrobacteraceae bacterium]
MDERVRIDKWLWAARLVKTRALAVDALKGGRVQVNGERAKPSREIHPGDRIEFASGRLRLSLVVRATSSRRGPASAAALLYDETAESREARERLAAEHRIERAAGLREGGRPTKRDRRRLDAARQPKGGQSPFM